MYSGKYFRARVATACHSSTVGGSKQFQPYAHADSYTNPSAHANSDSDSNANRDADSYPDSDAHTYSDSNAKRKQCRLCGRVEFHHCVSWWQCRQRRQQQLYGAVLEPGIKSDYARQQRPCRHG